MDINRSSSSRLTKQKNPIWITTEFGYIFMTPLDCQSLNMVSSFVLSQPQILNIYLVQESKILLGRVDTWHSEIQETLSR